jgi:methyltransferase
VSGVTFAGGLIIGLLLAETRLSRANERVLFGRGAIQPPGDVYRWMAVVYPVGFLAMIAEGAWRASAMPVVPPSGPMSVEGPAWAVSGIGLFAASKLLKYWAIASLGDRWTFKVIVEPGRPLVVSGPYAYIAHPNYVAVMGELTGAAIWLGAVVTGPIGLALFGLLLWRRLRFEERVLASSAAGS